jgi:hypothetical protein
MVESVWRRRAPVWLRIVTGILFFPALWLALAVSVWALLEFLEATDRAPGWPFLVAGVAAGLATWVIARRSSTPHRRSAGWCWHCSPCAGSYP